MTGPVVDVYLTPADLGRALRDDVRTGLTAEPKELPPKWFYDKRGSELFEAITRLPEYYPTRREAEILGSRAAEIAAAVRPRTVIELGAGSGEKTRALLDACVPRGLSTYVPFDVSERFLRESAAALAADYPDLRVHAVVGDFEHHLHAVSGSDRRLVAFLGGTVGNLRPAQRKEFLAQLASHLSTGDSLLLGADLVKDERRLLAAYDDAAGVTAEFNRNVLHVINRELDAHFVPERYVHVARWDSENEWIEMCLRSSVAQSVVIAALDLQVAFDAGEEVRTEISAKFRRARLEAELAEAGFELHRWWTDEAGDFSLSLATVT